MARQIRALATRDQILRGAAEVFLQSGYAGTSLSDITARAGVTKGAVYFHFSSKEKLAQTVIHRQHQTSIAAVSHVQCLGLRAVEQLVVITFTFSHAILTDPIVSAGTRLTFEVGQELGVTEPYKQWINAVEQLVVEAINDGDLLPGSLSAESISRHLVGAFTGVHLLSDVLTARADFVQRLAETWHILIRALVPADKQEHIAAMVRENSGYRLPERDTDSGS